MPASNLKEIEHSIWALPLSDQRLLLERLAGYVRETTSGDRIDSGDMDERLARMASDPGFQHELRAIAGDFAPTELDGLAQE